MTLTDRQRNAIEWEDGDLLIRGGPGTGKTEVIARRALYLSQRETGNNGELLLLTNTQHAAHSLRHYVRELLSIGAPGGREVTDLNLRLERIDGVGLVGTLQTFCSDILQKYGDLVGIDRFSVYGDAASMALVETILKEEGYNPQRTSPRAIRNEIARQKASSIEEETAPPIHCDADVLSAILPRYEKVLERTRVLDAQDLPRASLRLFREHSEIRRRYQQGFEHVLVDDIQNWTPVEVHLLDLLSADGTSVVATGDENQRVEGATGAEPPGTASFREACSPVSQITLTTSHRPGAPAASLAESLRNSGQFQRDPSANGSGGGTRADNVKEVAESDSDSPMTRVPLIECNSPEKEVRAVVERIEALKEEGVAYGDIAILTRTRQIWPALEEGLSDMGVPVETTEGLLEHSDISSLLAYVQAGLNPHDDRRILRIINQPSRGIGQKTKERLQAYASKKDLSLWDSISQAGEIDALTGSTRSSVRSFWAMLSPFVRAAAEKRGDERVKQKSRSSITNVGSELGERNVDTPASWIDALLDKSMFLQSVTRGNTAEHLAREERVREAIDTLTAEPNTFEALQRRIHRIALRDGWGDRSVQSVELSTLREAGGREFSVVFLPGLEEGLLPHCETTDRTPLLQNELRVFYVGLTRAEDRLFLSWSRVRTRDQTETPTSRSRFLDWVDEEQLITHSSHSPDDPNGKEAASDAAENESDDPDDDSSPEPHYYRENLRTQHAASEAQITQTTEEVNQIEEDTRVRHKKLGLGTVVETKGEGMERIATVEFDERGTKNVKLQYAPIEVVAET